MLFSKKIIKAFIYGILFFNLVDIFVSIGVIKNGLYKENNPFMNIFMKMDGIMPFILVKSILICSGCYFIYRYKDVLMAQIGAYLCFSFYWALIVHFYYLS